MARLLALTLGAASALSDFDAWKNEHRKSYLTVEHERAAAANWEKNDAIIKATNAKKLSYWLGHNEYSDLTADEFYSMYTGLLPNQADREPRPVFDTHLAAPPTAVDWVAKGGVTPVKNQGRCGSCWAFSTTGSIEGAYFVATGHLVSLSEEELVQCSHNGDHGCQGGLMDNGFTWVEKNGLCLEADDPYTSGTGTTGTCNGKSATCAPNVTVTGFTDVKSGDENALLAAVANQPVSIAIEADKSAFQMYKGGVLDNPACGTKLDHGVLVVGFGTDASLSKDYWKVKNSWGATWGEQGYIRMVRGSNQCGIAQQPSYPTGAKPAPPRPPAPPPAPPHYGDPKKGCLPDETAVSKHNVTGSWCAPTCFPLLKPCPKDTPPGVTATPLCSIKAEDSSTGKRECALSCIVGAGHGCGPNATCQGSGLSGICTYA